MTREPAIAVGLMEHAGSVTFQLLDEFTDTTCERFPPGEYRIACKGEKLICAGGIKGDFAGLTLTGAQAGSRFRLKVTIGIDFHWQQKRLQTFCGTLRFLPLPGNRITVINDLPLESYILSVSCSEMSAHSPGEFLKAHSIISRSWLLAQLESKKSPSVPHTMQPGKEGELIRWYDRQAHEDFDVCADDHCQRYQGIDIIASNQVSRAVESTRGLVLVYNGKPCDARFSKCCGGVTEDFRLAWDENVHPYLVPVFDGQADDLPDPPLSDERAARDFITCSPDVYCNCSDETILSRVLNNYDRATHDFFRWRVRLTPEEIAGLLKKKLDLDLGRIVALEPVERGLSARLKRLRLTGEKATVVIGKELEIRRVLSPTHLYSSAFVVDTEGPEKRPDSFVLSGAGWGHGVGLCQIGAAVMACRGNGYREILRHYYPGSVLERVYE
ncbi:MAG: SpoIID/LytB domain-containing protein [Chitinispirillaceae bacterium]|nr:SpoIID/LytB domain-containing protein [Chitinispirillaceae bacterium]